MGRIEKCLMTRWMILLKCAFLSSSLFAAAPRYEQLPLSFEPGTELGTWQARGSGLIFSVTQHGAEVQRGWSRLGMNLVGASATAAITPEEPLPGRASYLIGSDPSRWRTNLPIFARLRVHQPYPGIDLIFYGNHSQLEYDFVVAPGADPARIRLRFSGMSGLRASPDGSLHLGFPSGELLQKHPVLYQNIDGARRSVSGTFVRRGSSEIAFAVGDYDHSKPLVIDPVLTYSTYGGMGATYQATAVAVDGSGNSYVTGSTTGPRGDTNIFVSKINPAGNMLIYTATIGGAGDDIANGIAIDSTGAAFLTGQTSSNDFPVKNAFQAQTAGNTDAFLLRLDPKGASLGFATYIGGSGQDRAFAITLDNAGNAYVTGDTTADFPTSATITPFQRGPFGGYDAFVARFDNNGNANYSTYFGGSLDDHGFAIAVDAAENVYITGSTQSSSALPISANAFQRTLGGNSDAFVCVFNPTLSRVIYSTYLGGGDIDSGQGIAVDGAGSVYVTGSTSSNNFPAVAGSYQTNPLGGVSDIFLTKLAVGGTALIYSTILGGRGDDYANALAVDGAGNAYITGSTTSNNFPVTNDARQRVRNRLTDAFLLGLNPAGTALVYSTYFGGSSDETGQGIALDGLGGVYIVGQTSSPDFPITAGSSQTTYGGGFTDAFVSRFSIGVTVPTLNAGGIVNAASFAFAPIAPGSLFSIFGSNFATGMNSAVITPLPLSLGGYSVEVNGAAVPLVYAGANQINAQLPFEAGPTSATVVVKGPNGTSATSPVSIAQAAPGIFIYGANHGVIQNNDDGSTNSAAKPAKAGHYIIVYYTGQGPLDNSIATGAATPASPVSRAKLKTTATIGGVDASIYFAGMTPGFVALAQANIQVPRLQSADYPLVLTVNGNPSNSVVVSVSQ